MKSAIQRILLLIAAACLVTGQQDRSELDMREVAKSNNDFTSSFYNTVRQTNPGNLIFSPFSLSSAMAMVKAGARGVTAEEIQRGMFYPSDDKQLFSGYKSLLSTLESNENFTLETANRLYSQTGFALNPKYVETLREYFKAEASQLDFSQSAEAAKQINDFVENVTRNKIKDLVSSSDFDGLTRLVLVNAIYFKGLWANRFDPDNTKPSPFFTSLTENVTVDMMKSEADYPYVDLTSTLDAKAIAIPYKGNRLSMIVLLPNKIDGLAELERKLQQQGSIRLADIPDRMRSRKITLFMPKFRLETKLDLANILSQLGMKSMFEDTADFSGIPAPGSYDKLKISKAVQKAFIEVNEEGSEAAAATGIQLMLKSAFKEPQFRAQQPFLAFVYDNSTSTVLFLDTLTNPLIQSSEVPFKDSSVKPKSLETQTNSPAPNTDGKSGGGVLTGTLPLLLLPILTVFRQSLRALL